MSARSASPSCRFRSMASKPPCRARQQWPIFYAACRSPVDANRHQMLTSPPSSMLWGSPTPPPYTARRIATHGLYINENADTRCRVPTAARGSSVLAMQTSTLLCNTTHHSVGLSSLRSTLGESAQSPTSAAVALERTDGRTGSERASERVGAVQFVFAPPPPQAAETRRRR